MISSYVIMFISKLEVSLVHSPPPPPPPPPRLRIEDLTFVECLRSLSGPPVNSLPPPPDPPVEISSPNCLAIYITVGEGFSP